MTLKRIVCSTAAVAILFAAHGAPCRPTRQESTNVQTPRSRKLMDGKSIVGGTITTDDPNVYCAPWPTPASIFCGLKCSTAR